MGAKIARRSSLDKARVVHHYSANSKPPTSVQGDFCFEIMAAGIPLQSFLHRPPRPVARSLPVGLDGLGNMRRLYILAVGAVLSEGGQMGVLAYAPEANPLLLDINQVGIVSNVSQLLSQVRQGWQIVPAAQEMVGRRRQQTATIHGLSPYRATNFGYRIFCW